MVGSPCRQCPQVVLCQCCQLYLQCLQIGWGRIAAPRGAQPALTPDCVQCSPHGAPCAVSSPQQEMWAVTQHSRKGKRPPICRQHPLCPQPILAHLLSAANPTPAFTQALHTRRRVHARVHTCSHPCTHMSTCTAPGVAAPRCSSSPAACRQSCAPSGCESREPGSCCCIRNGATAARGDRDKRKVARRETCCSLIAQGEVGEGS